MKPFAFLNLAASERCPLILWSLGYCLFASIMIGIIRYISAELPSSVILFYRYFFALMLLMPYVALKGWPKIGDVRLHMYRAMLVGGAAALWFYAVSIMPLSEAVALNFTAPLFATVIAVLWLKEKVSKIQITMLLLGFLGVMVILRPGLDVMHMSAFLVLVASFLTAIAAVLIKVSANKISAFSLLFYLTLFVTPFTFFLALPNVAWPTISQSSWLLAIAVSGMLMQYALAKALTYGDISVVSPFDFNRLIFTSLIAFIVFDEALDIYTILGAVIILSSVTILAKNKHLKGGGANNPKRLRKQ